MGVDGRRATARTLDGRRWIAELERVYAEAAGVGR
jgi:hypothetical protein